MPPSGSIILIIRAAVNSDEMQPYQQFAGLTRFCPSIPNAPQTLCFQGLAGRFMFLWNHSQIVVIPGCGDTRLKECGSGSFKAASQQTDQRRE